MLAEYQTLLVTKPDVLRGRIGGETLIVTGASRGGTSLVAYVLLKLSYPLLADTGRNHELDAFLKASGDVDVLRPLITDTNARHPRWGVKHPRAARSLGRFVEAMRDPIVIMIYRNPLAIARSILKHESADYPTTEQGMERALRRSFEHMRAGSDAVKSSAPAILIDVDRSIAQPHAFIRELASLLKLQVSDQLVDEISQEIVVPGYKRLGVTKPGVRT
jgi:hypothetical protein